MFYFFCLNFHSIFVWAFHEFSIEIVYACALVWMFTTIELIECMSRICFIFCWCCCWLYNFDLASKCEHIYLKLPSWPAYIWFANFQTKIHFFLSFIYWQALYTFLSFSELIRSDLVCVSNAIELNNSSNHIEQIFYEVFDSQILSKWNSLKFI